MFTDWKTTVRFRSVSFRWGKAVFTSTNDDELRYGEINSWGRTILFGVRAEF